MEIWEDNRKGLLLAISTWVNKKLVSTCSLHGYPEAVGKVSQNTIIVVCDYEVEVFFQYFHLFWLLWLIKWS